MKVKTCYITIILWFMLLNSTLLIANDKAFELIMKDGQLLSHPVRVHVLETEITRNMDPKLCLVKLSDENIKKMKNTGCPGTTHGPIEIATNQVYIDDRTGEKPLKSATLLIFDLRKFSIHPLLTGSRVLPILNWKETDQKKDSKKKFENLKEYTAISETEVYLSNRTGTIIWTFFTITAFFIIAYMLTKKDPLKLLGFVTIKGGMSMSLTQMALWTIAVGGVVFGIGLMRLEVPEIPKNLVLLMVGAAGTAGFGHWQYYRWRRSKEKIDRSGTDSNIPDENNKEGTEQKEKILDMLTTIFDVEVDGKKRLSLAKGQIFFWTLITIILFVVKSVLEGKLWDVPEQLVLLMGVSQVSFLARNELAVREEGKKTEKLETANELVKKAEDAANRAESSASNAVDTLNKVEETLAKAEKENKKARTPYKRKTKTKEK